MGYLLDSNICIHLFRGKYGVSEKLQSVGLENCSISVITYAELIFGAEKSAFPDKNHQLIQDFIEVVTVVPILRAIHLYGKEKARLQKMGIIVSDFDLLIGCSAIVRDLIMVTENVKDFDKLSSIQIENWITR